MKQPSWGSHVAKKKRSRTLRAGKEKGGGRAGSFGEGWVESRRMEEGTRRVERTRLLPLSSTQVLCMGLGFRN